MNKRLYRSQKDRTIGGVCGGLGEYFAVDPVFIRIIAVVLVLADGIGFLAYLIAWIIIPNNPLQTETSPPAEGEPTAEGEDAAVPATPTETSEFASWNKYIPGGILIALGVFFIIREHYWWWHLEKFWPLLLIVFGLFFIFKVGQRHQKKQVSEGGTDEPS